MRVFEILDALAAHNYKDARRNSAYAGHVHQ